ncbi:NmrA family NAD(P)-binding protein [Streptomyces blastmyceticus]|uniref:NmrA-like domain-containing protein n=1 Tax=Streptomyces blastmyceticus TaxID=68180 RepID=A0ABN0WDT7_9ACTN
MTILVATPNGTVGRHLTEALRDRGDVRFFVRSEGGAKALGKVRGEVIRGDATVAADVRRAVVGVSRVFLAHPFSEDQVDAETNLGVAAVEAGARRIVKLGARRFTGNGIVPDTVTGAHDAIVERLRSAGVPELTVLQPDRFLQNFLSAAGSIAEGTLADPAGTSARGYVDVRDIAAVAVAELLAARPVGGEIEISGPQALTLPELCDRFGAALGRTVRYVDVPLDGAWRAALVDRGIASYVIDGLHGLYSNYRREGVAGLGDGVERVLGRPPRPVWDFAVELLVPALSCV